MRLLNWIFSLFKTQKTPYINESKDEWTIREFSEKYGKMQYLESLGWYRFVSNRRGETIVYVANILKNKTPKELLHDNRVFIKKLESGKFCLCSRYEDIEL